MRGRSSMRAPIIRCRTASWSPGGCGSARSSAPACSTSRRRGASIRAAAARCAATAISSSGPRTWTAIRSAAAASPSSRLEARIRLKQFGGNFGIVPFFDGGSLTDRDAARLQQLALRGRHRRALLFDLRPDPHRRRHAAQPAEGRRAGRRHCLARPGLLMADTARRRREPAPSHRGRLRADWRGGCSTSCSRCSSRCCSCSRGCWSCSTARPAIASSSTASPGSRPRRACESASGGSTARSSASRSCGMSAVADQPRRVPDLAEHQARLDAGRLARQ